MRHVGAFETRRRTAGSETSGRVVTCTIVRSEILFGIRKSPPGKRRAELEVTGHRFLGVFRSEPIPETAADRYAHLNLARHQLGLTLDENDLWIAATALALGATLVSRGAGFRAIEGLRVVALQ